MGLCWSDKENSKERRKRINSRSMSLKPLTKKKSLDTTEQEVKELVISNFDKYDSDRNGALD